MLETDIPMASRLDATSRQPHGPRRRKAVSNLRYLYYSHASCAMTRGGKWSVVDATKNNAAAGSRHLQTPNSPQELKLDQLFEDVLSENSSLRLLLNPRVPTDDENTIANPGRAWKSLPMPHHCYSPRTMMDWTERLEKTRARGSNGGSELFVFSRSSGLEVSPKTKNARLELCAIGRPIAVQYPESLPNPLFLRDKARNNRRKSFTNNPIFGLLLF